jgi:hypothetical protein
MLKVSQLSAAGAGAGVDATAAVELTINDAESTAAAIVLRRRTMTLFLRYGSALPRFEQICDSFYRWHRTIRRVVNSS